MKVKMTRELKIKFLQALKEGWVETACLPEITNPDAQEFDLSFLTDEERAVLLKIGEKLLE